MNRGILTMILLAACLAAAPRPALAKKEKAAFTIDPAYWERKINRIAILDVITPSGADDRVMEMEDMIQAALQEQGDFELIFPSDFKAAAERGGAREAYQTLHRVWHSRREIEGPALAQIGKATSVDALIGVEITHFEQFKLEFTQEGYSTTTVGLKIQMFDARDKKLLWQSSMVHVANSPPYNPANAVTSDAGGIARQTLKSVPEPPEYDDTAEKVIREVAGTYPKAKDAKAEKKKSSKEDGD